MAGNIPKRVSNEDAHTHHHRMLADRVLHGEGLIIGTQGQITVSWKGNSYVLGLVNSRSSATGQWRGEYDPTQSYNSGDTFKVSRVLVVDSQTVPKGLWGITPAGTDVVGNVWTGALPSNPTGAQVPQTAWVSGACAELIVSDCS
jgi:hypothetical protein